MASQATNSCMAVQQSIGWCEGSTQYPGVRRRIYYISKSAVATYPKLPKDEKGRPTSTKYVGDFVLMADQKWKYIDFIPSKSQLTSEPQGEQPSQTQVNKFVGVHPGVGDEASAMSLYVNNSDCIYIVQDMSGKYRVLGNDMWNTVSTVNQDNGQGNDGSASTTLNIEVTDVCPSPFYEGKLDTEDGEIDCSGAEE